MKGVLVEIKKQTLTLMIAAFGFVAALVWKDAISAWMAPFIEGAEGPMNLTIAAFVVTVIVVVVTIILAKVLGSKEGK